MRPRVELMTGPGPWHRITSDRITADADPLADRYLSVVVEPVTVQFAVGSIRVSLHVGAYVDGGEPVIVVEDLHKSIVLDDVRRGPMHRMAIEVAAEAEARAGTARSEAFAIGLELRRSRAEAERAAYAAGAASRLADPWGDT